MQNVMWKALAEVDMNMFRLFLAAESQLFPSSYQMVTTFVSKMSVVSSVLEEVGMEHIRAVHKS